MRKLRPHLTYANVTATVALVVAIGGGSFAVAKTAKIGPKQLKNGAVTRKKLTDGAVSGAKLADRAVSARKLADGTVGARQLAAVQVVANAGTSGLGVTCPAGTKLIGGGGVTDGQLNELNPDPASNSWHTSAMGAASTTAVALCITAASE